VHPFRRLYPLTTTHPCTSVQWKFVFRSRPPVALALPYLVLLAARSRDRLARSLCFEKCWYFPSLCPPRPPTSLHYFSLRCFSSNEVWFFLAFRRDRNVSPWTVYGLYPCPWSGIHKTPRSSLSLVCLSFPSTTFVTATRFFSARVPLAAESLYFPRCRYCLLASAVFPCIRDSGSEIAGYCHYGEGLARFLTPWKTWTLSPVFSSATVYLLSPPPPPPPRSPMADSLSNAARFVVFFTSLVLRDNIILFFSLFSLFLSPFIRP